MKKPINANLVFTLIAVVSLLVTAPPLLAHHGSRISYDLKKQVTVTGTVAGYYWINPHVYFLLDVKDDKGKVVQWGAETYAPVIMARDWAWTRNSMKPGDKVTVTIFPSKEGAPRGFIEKVVLPDGKITDFGNPTE